MHHRRQCVCSVCRVPNPRPSFLVHDLCTDMLITDFLNTGNTMDATSGTDRSYISTGSFSVFKSGLCLSIFSFYVKLCEQCFSFFTFFTFFYIYIRLKSCHCYYVRSTIRDLSSVLRKTWQNDIVSIYI